ncbi:MAG: hypothetical protein H6721_11245 [Sandaracinus sp.]|nr:hypothetical protein [Sandaracinus sp.]MCB9619114.1 hypothetical protein [Sandaracinus sp.]MCB9632697.1 hypothetical protein [Sandaracinus sp.]
MSTVALPLRVVSVDVSLEAVAVVLAVVERALRVSRDVSLEAVAAVLAFDGSLEGVSLPAFSDGSFGVSPEASRFDGTRGGRPVLRAPALPLGTSSSLMRRVRRS